VKGAGRVAALASLLFPSPRQYFVERQSVMRATRGLRRFALLVGTTACMVFTLDLLRAHPGVLVFVCVSAIVLSVLWWPRAANEVPSSCVLTAGVLVGMAAGIVGEILLAHGAPSLGLPLGLSAFFGGGAGVMLEHRIFKHGRRSVGGR
jgi:hypothetical protein